MENRKLLYSLISPADFSNVQFAAILGTDEQEYSLAAFCLESATRAIERYCMRRLLKKRHCKTFAFTGDYVFPLRSYPVWEVLGVWEEEWRAGSGERRFRWGGIYTA
jgi:hypothetical protein